ncbi:hypothetical protein JW899_02895 [Candidatus Uhrbacteria bacterium]|nr:hypothetical protein [Candidatus Uhrbacteria bacterium]
MRKFAIAIVLLSVLLTAGIVLVVRERNRHSVSGVPDVPLAGNVGSESGLTADNSGPTQPFCGDYVCDTGETIAGCPIDCPPTVMSGVEIRNQTADVSWKSLIPVTISVRYGSGTLDRTANLDRASTEHELRLEGIEPDTIYDLCVVSVGEDGTRYPESCDEFRSPAE